MTKIAFFGLNKHKYQIMGQAKGQIKKIRRKVK